VTVFQLNQSEIERAGVSPADAEHDRINDAGTRRTGNALKEGDAPVMLPAIRPQCFLVRGLSGPGLRKCAHALAGLHGLSGSGATLARKSGFLAGRKIVEWRAHSISSVPQW
jgi:hypothetical protein